MNRTVKNLINKTIDLEYRMLEEDITDLKKFENYLEVSQEFVKLESKVYKIIPAEYYDLVEKFIETGMLLSDVEKRYIFKQGVIKGLTDLSYLNDDIGIEVTFI